MFQYVSSLFKLKAGLCSISTRYLFSILHAKHLNSDPRIWFPNLWQQWISRNLMLVQMPSATVPPSALARKDINGSSQCVSSLQCAKHRLTEKSSTMAYIYYSCNFYFKIFTVESETCSELKCCFQQIYFWTLRHYFTSLSMSYVCWSSSSDLVATQRQVESDEINFNAAISACEKCQRWQRLVQITSDDIRQHQTTSFIIFLCSLGEKWQDVTRSCSVCCTWESCQGRSWAVEVCFVVAECHDWSNDRARWRKLRCGDQRMPKRTGVCHFWIFLVCLVAVHTMHNSEAYPCGLNLDRTECPSGPCSESI